MLLKENQIPYAFAKLNESTRIIKSIVNELPSLRERLNKQKLNKSKARIIYDDLKQQYNKLTAALDSIILPLLEMELTDLAAYTNKLNQSLASFNLLTPDYSKLCAIINNYLSKLPDYNQPESQTTNAAIIGRLMNDIKMGYYPTDLEHIKMISSSIEFPDIMVNILDPCCGCGNALQQLASGHDCRTYGIEIDSFRAEDALTRLDRVGFGSYFHSRISNDAFHLILLNPPYLSVLSEGGNNTRSEKRFLVDSLWNLMYGGVLIYIIPYYRLTPDIGRVLCDNFDDITIWKFMKPEFEKFKQIAIMGVRRKRQDGSALISDLVSLVSNPSELPELENIPKGRYDLPKTLKKIDLFKGAKFNVAELVEQLNRSTSFSRLFEKNKLDSTVKRPLLPLNLGQIGLIGGSGLINGLVNCDNPHIIKGRIVKENRISAEENLNNKGDHISTTLFETRSNKMIFNLLTPNGFLSLTDYDVVEQESD